MKKQSYTNQELLMIATKMWASNRDIMALADVSIPKAKKIRIAIEEQIKEEGKLLPTEKVVPMKRVLKMLDITLTDLERRAFIEQKMPPAATDG